MVPAATNGLYDSRFEHDACGVGFVADLRAGGFVNTTFGEDFGLALSAFYLTRNLFCIGKLFQIKDLH